MKAYLPDPTQHEIGNKTIKYHAARDGDPTRAHCSRWIKLDTASGDDVQRISKYEICQRCVKALGVATNRGY